jgi:hypothetical protein
VRIRVVVGVLVALVAAGVLVTLSVHGTRLAGTNLVRLVGLDVKVPAGATVCQPRTPVAGDAGGVRMTIGTYHRPRPALMLHFYDADGALTAAGRLPGGRGEGRVTVPFARPVRGPHSAGPACVHNDGRTPILLGGDVATAANAARVAAGPPQGVIAFTYVRAQRESWWPLLGRIARRFPIGKVSFLGAWSLWACALVLLGVWIAALRLLLRELPR